jgi:hypothetical protein
MSDFLSYQSYSGKTGFFSIRLLIVLLGYFLSNNPLVAEQNNQSIEYELTPYLWAATVDGTLAVGGDSSSAIDSGYNFFSLDNLDGVASATFTARGHQWGFLFDYLYVAYEDTLFEGSVIQLKPRLEGRISELAATYQPSYINDFLFLGGIRRQDIEVELTYLNRTPQDSVDWIDPFVGVIYSPALTKRVSLSLRGDIGGFGIESERALNAEAMLRYQFSKTFSFKFGYRYIEVEFKENDFIYDISLDGFQFGLGIRF